MSLPNYLSKIKSAGIYRFVFDKSEVPGGQAETMRLVVGYSEKGPFNTPVYVESISEFETIFGGVNKKLERRGCFFHRLAEQALGTGPILAINLKPFDTDSEHPEQVKAAYFNVTDQITSGSLISLGIEDIYDTTRFWHLEPEGLGARLATKTQSNKYITITATDSVETTNTVFFRGYHPTGYDISFKEWYSSVLNGEELPSYMEGHEMDKVSDYFAECYIFRGEFTPEIATSEALAKYFDVNGTTVTLKPYILNAFGEKRDTLVALAGDTNSNFVNSYSGILLPNFTTANGGYISLDLMFNAGNDNHKMMMNLNVDALYDGEVSIDDLNTTGWGEVATALAGQTGHQIGLNYVTLNGMSIGSAKPVVSRATVQNGEWSYSDAAPESYTDPDFYSYTIVNPSRLTTDNRVLVTTTDISQIASPGDRFIVKCVDGASTTGSVVTVTSTGSFTTGEGSEAVTSYTITFDKEIASEGILFDGLIKCNHPVYETCQGLTPVAFEGYTYGLQLPSSDMMEKLNWQKAILDTLTKYEGIRMALTNRKDSEYHYLVDTFESYVQTELKSTFGVIAKEKDNCLALVNFPSIKTFKDCPYSSYTDNNGKFQTKYIADGYNKQKPASVYFSLMSEFNGASFVSYNTPVVLTDGTVKTYCPSAALVSNCFMAKYDTRLPYSIVAGPTYGRITATGLVGPDFNFSRADLDILEPMGVNCMVYVPRKGTYINSNQTAKQNPVTALSKINVRELVIFLQDEIENLMQNYQWEYNTQELRDTIKSKADTICEKIKANGGLYEYINVCDSSNNTDEIIDNEMIILDTSIEPGRGAGKMVQRLYIYRTGALKAMMS